jgi:DNA-binding NarL/FixJ family response regulator
MLLGTGSLDDVEDVILRIAAQHHLSPRERDVFTLMVKGYTRKMIMQALVLSNSTVKTHVSHIYEKMDVGSRQELLALVFDQDDWR